MPTMSIRLCALATATLTLAACGGSSAPEPEAEPRAVAEEAARVASLTLLSGPSPFAPAACGALDDPVYGVVYASDPHEFGDEGDLSIAVNPGNPRHIVVAWQQDIALGILSSASFDGGRTWQTNVIPSLTHCQDLKEERVFHSRLGFGPDGRVYLANEADDGFIPDPRQVVTIRVPVSTSVDGGLEWTTRYIDEGTAGGTKGLSTLAAEPDVAGAAVVAWHNEPNAATLGAYVSRTSDGGATWTKHFARAAAPGSFPFNRILALRDGRLLMFGIDLIPEALPGAAGTGLPFPVVLAPLLVTTSSDKAATWSEPVEIGQAITGQWPSAVEAPNGDIYLSWTAPDATGAATQYVARSEDGGATWTDPVAAARPNHRHTALAVSGSGVVGFVYTDARNDVPPEQSPVEQLRDGPPPKMRDVWLAYSRDRGETWQELHVAGPFPLADGDLRNYQETTGLPGGFAAAVLLGPPYAQDGRTDVFYAELQVPGATRSR